MTKSKYPLVTVAIPTYNRAGQYLQDALKSAVSQAYPNLEIIVADNCSNDNTEELVYSFSDDRIKYIKQSTNIGGINNWNYCVKKAKGDYFLLLHDDDMIDEDFIETCIRSANYDSNFGVIRTGTRIINEYGNVLNETTNNTQGLKLEDFFLGWFANYTTLYLCSTLYNTRKLQEIGGFKSKTNLFLDALATVKLSIFGRVDVPEVKASFRRHSNNMGSKARLMDWVDDCKYLLDIMCDLVPEDAKDVVKQKGNVFFCKKNYRYISANSSFFDAIGYYWSVYKRYDYCYSPVRHLYIRYKSAVRRRLRNIISQ